MLCGLPFTPCLLSMNPSGPAGKSSRLKMTQDIPPGQPLDQNQRKSTSRPSKNTQPSPPSLKRCLCFSAEGSILCLLRMFPYRWLKNIVHALMRKRSAIFLFSPQHSQASSRSPSNEDGCNTQAPSNSRPPSIPEMRPRYTFSFASTIYQLNKRTVPTHE